MTSELFQLNFDKSTRLSVKFQKGLCQYKKFCQVYNEKAGADLDFGNCSHNAMCYHNAFVIFQTMLRVDNKTLSAEGSNIKI